MEFMKQALLWICALMAIFAGSYYGAVFGDPLIHPKDSGTQTETSTRIDP